jgi:hypothetical protein
LTDKCHTHTLSGFASWSTSDKENRQWLFHISGMLTAEAIVFISLILTKWEL